MSQTQKKRSEIDVNYQWDLKPIFETDTAWEDFFAVVSKEMDEITSFKGKVVSSASDLLKYLEFSMQIERKLYKLYFYAHLKHDQDTTNATYQEMKGKIDALLARYNELSAFANPEMMEVDYSQIVSYYGEEPKLKEYEFLLENIYRYKDHILSKEEEKIVSSFNRLLDSPEEIFSSLTDSDMKFGYITDEEDKEVELTESNYSNFLKSNNRDVRRQAFTQLLTTYGNFKNAITDTFKGNIEALTTLAKLKHYNSSLEASLFNENIDKKVYFNLIDTVSNHLDIVYKYFALKKKVLGLDEIHLYDLYVDLTEDYDKKYTFEEAKELVLESLSVLGDDYVATLNKAFDEKWIDVYNNVGKRGGAYSSGFYDTNPYILLNFEGKIGDVSTLAHELGHSMHTYYSCKNNPYQYSSYQIFVAEVASTVNELLLSFHMLKKSNNKDEKKFILSTLLDLFKATIYRQTMFAEFEMMEHKHKEDGQVLTYESLCNDYYKLNEKYFGPDVVIDDEIKYEWERIPHFYYNFYVYKYAIGLSCACYIVDNILNNKEGALEDYRKFLSSGGSDYPINELKIAGIDVTSKEVVESALKMFDSIIDDFNGLC